MFLQIAISVWTNIKIKLYAYTFFKHFLPSRFCWGNCGSFYCIYPNSSFLAEMNALMTEALINDDIPFIKILLEHKINFKEYVTVDRLQYLFSLTQNDNTLINCFKFCRIKVTPTTSIPAEIKDDAFIDESNQDLKLPDKSQYDENVEALQTPYPSQLRLYHINMLMQKLILKFHSKYYELTRTVCIYIFVRIQCQRTWLAWTNTSNPNALP